MKFILYLLFFGLLSCSSKTEVTVENSTVPKNTNAKIKLSKLNKLFVVGDFDGDGLEDTLFQYNYSSRTKTEIEYSADPFQNDWETVVKWFYDHDAIVYLSVNKTNHYKLNLGLAQGLYCLINIGDNNADGKDEIALVVDYLDFSSANSCKIYSLCNDKWTLMKRFSVHEYAFDFTSEKKPIFVNIKDFLERKNGQWFYKDYHKDLLCESKDDIGKMLLLDIDKCR